jgi:hypothetical protein
VRDLTNEAIETRSHLIFQGTKRISCAQGRYVEIEYVARLTAGGRRTTGDWWVIGSTLAGATTGSGTLRGDFSACTTLPGSDGYVLDTFTGDVS